MKEYITRRIAQLEKENTELTNGSLILINQSIISELKVLALIV